MKSFKQEFCNQQTVKFIDNVDALNVKEIVNN